MQIVDFRLKHTGTVTICLQIIHQLHIQQQPTETSECAFVKKKMKGGKRKEQKETGTDMILSSNFQWRRPKCQQAKLKILKIPEETLYSFNSTAHLAKNLTWTSKAWSNQKSSTPYPDTHRVRSWPHMNPCWNFHQKFKRCQHSKSDCYRPLLFTFFAKKDILKTIVPISSAASQFTVRGWLNWTLVNERCKQK